MTISNTIRTAGPYIGNGVTTAFPFYFKIFKTADLLAVQTDVATGVATSLVLNSGYTVTLNSDQNANPGGTATLPAALATGQTLVLTSALEYLQPIDITNGGGFYPAVLNAALDRLTIFCQQLYSLASRSLRFPLSDSGLNTELPSAVARAGKLLGFDSDGKPVAVAPASGSAIDLAMSLISSIGASFIAWRRAAAGAVTRLLSSWIEEFELTPRSFGCACDGVTIDNVPFGLFLNACAGRWGVIPDGDLVRLTASPTSLTSFPVRLRGRSNQWHTGQQTIAAGRDYGGILLDGAETAIGGTWNLATNTVTYPQRVKGLCNLVIAGTNGARHGLLDFLDNAVVHGVHFQGFTDHHMFTFGSILCSYRDISGWGTLLGKAASGTWLAGDFINGCAWHMTGSSPSGVAGNYLAGRVFGSSNFSSTNDVSNAFADTVQTQTTSSKGFIFINVRSTAMKNCGSYSGAYMAYCNIQWDSPHFETYATGGEVAGDGNPQSFVALNSTIKTSNYDGGTTLPPLILRTTPFTAGTDYWMYDIQTNTRRQFSRIGFNELILGEKLSPGSTASQHVASLGTVANPMVYFDKVMNALRVSCGLSFQPLLGIPIVLPGTVGAATFVDITSADLCPSVDGGSGPGGIYDIDVQIFDAANGNVFYFGTWVGARQIPGGQFAIRFYGQGKDNNPPAGGFTVTESLAASIYRLRITNGTAAPYAYRLTSRLRCVTIPQPV